MKISILSVTLLLAVQTVSGQQQPEAWSLSKCINQALTGNLQLKQAALATGITQVNREQALASRFPVVEATARQSFAWSDQLNNNGTYDFTGSNSSSASISSSATLFNGFRKENTIKQSQLNYQSAVLDEEAYRQDITLQVLDSYLQVLYAGELVENSKNQLISTQTQLSLSEERLKLRIISQADFLQVKSQEAAEKLTLATAEKQLQLSRLNLMQLMEIPVSDDFTIEKPDLSDAAIQLSGNSLSGVYESALASRPEIRNAALQKEIAAYDIQIAKAGYLPSLSINAGLSTQYSSLAENLKFASQLDHNLSPTAGLTLSIPIFQQKQVKSQVSLARINASSAEISEQNTRNQLRKSIETAWTDVVTAEKEFEAGNEKYAAARASFAVSEERFAQGIISPVDFLYEKTSLINAESNLLQARYNLIFSYKVIEFYQGKELKL